MPAAVFGDGTKYISPGDVAAGAVTDSVTPRGSAVFVGVSVMVKVPHVTWFPRSVEVQDTSVGPV